MQKKYVVGLGDNVVDYYSNQNIKYPGGNAVNFSVFSPKELVNSYYVGSVANDSDGDAILESLKKEKVRTEFCNRIEGQTEKTFVNIVNGERIFLDSVKGKRELPSLDNPKLMDLLRSALVVYSSCHSNSESTMEKLHAIGIQTAYDFSEMPKYHTEEYLRKVSKNIDIAQFSLSESSSDDRKRLLHSCIKYGTKFALFTNGGEPPLLFDCTRKRKYVGKVEYNPNPVDTMGAGDTFFANLVTYLFNKSVDLSDLAINEINMGLSFAARASAKTIQRRGSYGYGQKIK